MARFVEGNTKDVYEVAHLFRTKCLEAETSLLFDGTPLWTAANLDDLKEHFVDSPEHGDRAFLEKFAIQIDKVPTRARLAAEVLTVYFLFPDRVLGPRKRSNVETVLGWGGDKLDPDHIVSRAFNTGIGSAGQGYNTRRPIELYFIIALMSAWRRLPPAEQRVVLADPWKFRDFVDEVPGAGSSQFRHMILHFIFPDHFERSASRSHKKRLVDVFGPLVEETDGSADLDERLLSIRKHLESLRPGESIDFYRKPYRAAWYDEDDVDTVGQYTPIELLHHKKQVVLYGPPGTGKTHRAKDMAEKIIRSAAVRAWKAKSFEREKELQAAVGTGGALGTHIHRLQLHPGYGYEDFVRGLHLGENGQTEYRPGFLLDLVDDIAKAKAKGDELPHVLILDELNRADLSRLLGECFSLLEDRESAVKLLGRLKGAEPMHLRIPKDLYVIGTMNLIDQSLEQVDFALRRRFLWICCPFSAGELLRICESRWTAQLDTAPQGGVPRLKVSWDRVASDFEQLTEAAATLNKAIRLSPSLGPQYEIGHTYFLDVVEFLARELRSHPKRRTYLWDRGEATDPVREVWRLSLRPLLDVYLSGLDSQTSTKLIAELEQRFLSAGQPIGS